MWDPFTDEKKKVIDISPLISGDLAVFPGDRPFSRQESFSTLKGQHMTLSSMETTLHIGAHTDAPIHYHADGKSIDQKELEDYLGPCQVMSVNKNKNEKITPEDILDRDITCERVLFRTKSYDPYSWSDDFNSLSDKLIEFLAEKKVKLVGIDTPSIDPAKCDELHAHQMVFQKKMSILEGIVLDHVSDGTYFLMALPLKIKDGDASPVRAVLIK